MVEAKLGRPPEPRAPRALAPFATLIKTLFFSLPRRHEALRLARGGLNICCYFIADLSTKGPSSAVVWLNRWASRFLRSCDKGLAVIGPVATVAEARPLVAEQKPALAVVDINLKGELTYPLIDQLHTQECSRCGRHWLRSAASGDGKVAAAICRNHSAKRICWQPYAERLSTDVRKVPKPPEAVWIRHPPHA